MGSQKGNRSNVPAAKQTTYLKRFWIIFISFIAFLFLLFISISLGLFGRMPSFEELENPKSNLATEIISSDNKVLGKYFIENRSNVHYQDLSPQVVNALIATEDIRFEQHSGVDVKAVFRMVFGVFTGISKGGASTITQQLAKNLFPRKKNPSKFYLAITKLKEWVTAIKLERNYSKEEILAMYLNTVDFGSQSFGIKSASRTYFNKSPSELKTEEAALLIGILQAPTMYSPVRNPEKATERRNTVLRQMEKYEFISGKECDSLKAISLDMSHYLIQDHTAGLATYFREYLRGVLNGWCQAHPKEDGTQYNLYKDGLRIYTTINSVMQTYAEEAVSQYIGQELQPVFFRHWKGYLGKDIPMHPSLLREVLKRRRYRT
jgi:penicillin-binding protein 1A